MSDTRTCVAIAPKSDEGWHPNSRIFGGGGLGTLPVENATAATAASRDAILVRSFSLSTFFPPLSLFFVPCISFYSFSHCRYIRLFFSFDYFPLFLLPPLLCLLKRPPAHTHQPPEGFTHSHTHTHTHSLSLSLSLSHTHTHSLSHLIFFSFESFRQANK